MLDERRRTGGRTEERNAGEIMGDYDLHENFGVGRMRRYSNTRVREAGAFVVVRGSENAMMLRISIKILVVSFVWVSDKMHGMCR
jgi:hypothetical protein